MKLNLGGYDRIARIAIAALLVLGAWWLGFGSIAGIVLLVLAVVLVATSAIGFCPLYAAFGLTTKHRPTT